MVSQKRPIIEIPYTPIQRLFTALSLILLIADVIYMATVWSSIPDRVPGHYNAAGEVDRWGRKGELIALPVMAFVMWLGFTVLEKYPHVYNYINLTEQNAEKQYKYGRGLINTLKLEIVTVLAYISYESIHIAQSQEDTSILGVWDLPIFIALIFGTLGYYLYKMLRAK